MSRSLYQVIRLHIPGWKTRHLCIESLKVVPMYVLELLRGFFFVHLKGSFICDTIFHILLLNDTLKIQVILLFLFCLIWWLHIVAIVFLFYFLSEIDIFMVVWPSIKLGLKCKKKKHSEKERLSIAAYLFGGVTTPSRQLSSSISTLETLETSTQIDIYWTRPTCIPTHTPKVHRACW